ncbi:glutamate 5-kinase [Salisediminibacterium selenitireducens]|uniref:Glutamate 5-kinase n=1 Tax=Bacillus selenitireducens (strain ATCC 700615 / DSM 15326 / MLS10) TaxID=439292 RepID=D6XUG4_BACIE|nr:glutamate 5-kinase [Salisediminibacterium selenitireducens]ADH99450.1 glutamate 5-kinase [[Bacillus] selenitireducens MLS10]
MHKSKIVIKIGTSSLASSSGALSEDKLHQVVTIVSEAMEAGHQVILVSSGAIAAGYERIGYPVRPETTKAKQAAASVGQAILMNAYQEAFMKRGIVSAQLLLTKQEIIQEASYHHLQNTMTELLQRKVLPIINENDSTSIDELTFGDNDHLASLVSGFIHADYCILYTDVDGIYDKNPKLDRSAKRIRTITASELEKRSDIDLRGGSSQGTGGMAAKLHAALQASGMGASVFIGKLDQRIPSLVETTINGDGPGTYIISDQPVPLRSKKQWIAFHSPVSGELTIDEGAVNALLSAGKSLLAVGILGSSGDFNSGSTVIVRSSDASVIGKGRVRLSSDELNQQLTHKMKSPSPVVIHRDEWISVNDTYRERMTEHDFTIHE